MNEPWNERSEDQARQSKAHPPFRDSVEVLLAPTDGQTNDDPVRNTAHSPPDGIVDHDLLPSISSITAVAEVFVESKANLVQNLGHASMYLPREIPPDNREIVNESVTRSGSEPLESQNFVLHFGRCDEGFGLLRKPLCLLRRQDDRGPMERRSDEWLAFAAVLRDPLPLLLLIKVRTAVLKDIPSPIPLLDSYARTSRRVKLI